MSDQFRLTSKKILLVEYSWRFSDIDISCQRQLQIFIYDELLEIFEQTNLSNEKQNKITSFLFDLN